MIVVIRGEAAPWTATIPGRPGHLLTRSGWLRVLTPNGRAHWRQKAKCMRKDKEAVYVAVRSLGGSSRDSPALTHAHVKVTFYVTVAARRDADNLLSSLKGVLDGLVDAGVLVDDSLDVIGMPEIAVVVDKARAYSYEIEVTA